MAFRYKHKITGEIIERNTPLPADMRKDYIMVSWVRNMMMKAVDIMKK